VRIFHPFIWGWGWEGFPIEGDYKTKWLVTVVIFCSVLVITSSRPQEQETTKTTFFSSFFFSFSRRALEKTEPLKQAQQLQVGVKLKREILGFIPFF